MNATTVEDILATLESLGSESVRKHSRKNGAGDNQFGVKMGDIRKVAAGIKNNHELGLALWQTQNIDAQLVAILVIKPKMLSTQVLEDMVRAIPYSQVADWLNAYVVKKHPEKETLRLAWLQSDDLWLARSGWSLTSERIGKDPEELDLAALLDRIDQEMPTAPKEVQWTMNFCLAGIGINFAEYRDRAMQIGESLGVFRDFPTSKGCTSPFAPIWITEMVKRQG
jgi:3-methyladenine DNA glycosylase AlkD